MYIKMRLLICCKCGAEVPAGVQCECGHSPNPYDPECQCLRRTIGSAGLVAEEKAGPQTP